jgi:hypothetical protein
VSLLDMHGRPDLGASIELSQGSGLTAEPMAKSRATVEFSSTDAGRAFDAKELFLRDRHKANCSDFHSIALLFAVHKTLTSPTYERFDGWDAHRVSSALEELAKRGYSTTEMIRRGLRVPISGALCGEVAAYGLVKITLDESEFSEHFYNLNLETWYQLVVEMCANDSLRGHEITISIDSIKDEKSRELAQRYVTFCAERLPFLVARWVATVPIAELVEWQAPTLSWAQETPEPSTDYVQQSDRSSAEWIWDRFTNTYLKDWEAASLNNEWKYRRGHLAPPVPSREMMLREIDTEKLAHLVADANTISGGRSSINRRLVQTAANLLREGHRSAAASLFDALIASQVDDNGEVRNNLGFCLLPDNPSRAYSELDRARREGYDGTVNVANRMLALHWLGRSVMAIDLADRQIGNWDKLDDHPAFLWEFSKTRSATTLLRNVIPREYVVRLACFISRESDDAALIARWSRVASERGLGA